MVCRVPGAAVACSGLACSPLNSSLSGGSPVENSELQLETTCLETEDVPLKEKSRCLSAQMTALGHYLLFSCASSRAFMGCYQGKCRNNDGFCSGSNLDYRWPGGSLPRPLDFARAWRLGGARFFPAGCAAASPARVPSGFCFRGLLGNSSAGQSGDDVSVASCYFLP